MWLQRKKRANTKKMTINSVKFHGIGSFFMFDITTSMADNWQVLGNFGAMFWQFFL